ncbi:cytochrome b/b6 domain-containing protein [Thalassococcus sp. CAU 1522]|uniref:Cytochrome b/b6 domain-containing protein n=1 Tax=Thalassococcus arenae TaxID=2851652 RepID=A0ABS6N3B5_9RHOB|nr:cytochrome b/b6 domain-containing protein [Thalassococcus arenae]MBV2358499.1 cytochrome b/b6 domain-containing protein [Thalassococcus arenae]
MRRGYSLTQIRLHWAVMVLVALQYLLHEPMSDAFDRLVETGQAQPTALVALHVFGGFVIFVLTLVRLAIRRARGAPPPPEGEPELFRLAGIVAHQAFYVFLIALPVTGAFAWFRGDETAGDIHEILRALLLALIALHVAAVVVHQFVWKTGVLDRMRHPAE